MTDYRSSALVCCAAISLSCGAQAEDENTIGGDTNVPLGQVGNVITTLGAVNVGGTSVNIGASLTVTQNEDGVATFTAIADLTTDARLAVYNDLLPDSARDSQGRINTQVRFRITSEGLQDYFNIDERQHTLVKYSGQVGDQYRLTKSDGVTITREITARSDEDDFLYGTLYIKTITVEQDSRIPGIRKFIYRANHRFGIVYFEVVAEDGGSVSAYLSSANS